MIHHSAPFFRAYRAVPHWLVNRVALEAAKRTRPRWLVQAAVRRWIASERIDMRDFEDGPFSSLEHFFLRRLRPGARPIEAGLVSPVDGCVVGHGPVERGTILQVKGHPISIDRLVNGRGLYDVPLGEFEGGAWVTLFLRPRGYHYVHAPADLTVEAVRWIPGRFFPQNEAALRQVPRIYERNERAVLSVRLRSGLPAILVMVGASVIGGIHVRGVRDLRRTEPTPLDRVVDKGAELGHFDFGSTVVLLLPRGHAGVSRVELARETKMGETLFAETS
jgi:phosphatidylserine decarboxylase